MPQTALWRTLLKNRAEWKSRMRTPSTFHRWTGKKWGEGRKRQAVWILTPCTACLLVLFLLFQSILQSQRQNTKKVAYKLHEAIEKKKSFNYRFRESANQSLILPVHKSLKTISQHPKKVLELIKKIPSG